MNDDILGLLTFDDRLNQYTGKIIWLGREVELAISICEDVSLESLTPVAHKLLAAQESWVQKAIEYAVDCCLDMKNQGWLEEGEPICTRERFIAAISLSSIVIDEEAGFEFRYDDGGLFGGHFISINGNLEEGLTYADLLG